LDSFPLLAIPLFMLAGELMEKGVAQDVNGVIRVSFISFD
jgi:TRAP-type C4-dicarboxylate transport system permease large subunit